MAYYLTILAFAVHVLLGCCAHHHHCVAEQVVAVEMQHSPEHAGCSHAAVPSAGEEQGPHHSSDQAAADHSGHSHSDSGQEDPCTEVDCQYVRGGAPEIISVPALSLTTALPIAFLTMVCPTRQQSEPAEFLSSGSSPRTRCAHLHRWLV